MLLYRFSLFAFNIFSLFFQFGYHVSWHVPPWVCPAWGAALPGLGWLFPFQRYEIFQLSPLQIFSQVFPLSLWAPHNENVGRFSVVPGLLDCPHLIPFSLFHGSDFEHLVFQFIYSFYSVILLFIPSSIIHLCLFFNSSRSLVNISCIFSIFASILSPNPGSSSLSLFWFLFLESGLSPLHLVVFLGFYLIPSFGT